MHNKKGKMLPIHLMMDDLKITPFQSFRLYMLVDTRKLALPPLENDCVTTVSFHLYIEKSFKTCPFIY